MALGFRKSIFGYNCEDVSEYLLKNQNSHKQAVAALNDTITELREKLADAEENNTKLCEVNSDLQSQLDFYKSKYEEVKTLSENIGKLYLVAQTNAKSIINAADEARAASLEEIEDNIAVISNTNAALSDIKENILKMSDNFVNEIEKLTASLEKIKTMATSADENGDAKKDEFEKVFKNITE